MAEKGYDSERTENLLLNSMPIEWAEMGKERIKVRIDECIDLQTELFDKLQETNRQWLDRAHSEANCASEFASNMTAARCLPEVMAAYQEWTAREFEMIAQDGQRFLDNIQKFMAAGIRLLSGYLYVTRRPAE